MSALLAVALSMTTAATAAPAAGLVQVPHLATIVLDNDREPGRSLPPRWQVRLPQPEERVPAQPELKARQASPEEKAQRVPSARGTKGKGLAPRSQKGKAAVSQKATARQGRKSGKPDKALPTKASVVTKKAKTAVPSKVAAPAAQKGVSKKDKVADDKKKRYQPIHYNGPPPSSVLRMPSLRGGGVGQGPRGY